MTCLYCTNSKIVASGVAGEPLCAKCDNDHNYTRIVLNDELVETLLDVGTKIIDSGLLEGKNDV